MNVKCYSLNLTILLQQTPVITDKLRGGGVIDDVRCNRVKGYARKYNIGYIANKRNKHRNTQCYYMSFHIFY
jgi:hypothetical protein